MGNADWNPAQTRVFDVYMAGGGGQGGQNLVDIFSCNGGNSGSNNSEGNNDDDDGDSSRTTNKDVSPSSVSESGDSGTEVRDSANIDPHTSAVTDIGNSATATTAGSAGSDNGVYATGTAGINAATSPSFGGNGMTELYNSGTGRAPPSLTPDFFERLKRRKVETSHRVTPALNLRPMDSSSVSAASTRTSTPPTAAHAPLSSSSSTIHPPGTGRSPPSAAYGQTDKWPSQMESAFVSALRIIIKNGTSKFKILDRNYGRNELISLYVEYHTGEVRTKKQISSHIQVWKKSILNKVSGNFKLSSLDLEMLRLIEDGAPQSDDANRFFYGTFEQIVNYLLQQRRVSTSAVNGTSFDFFRPNNPTAGAGSDYLLTPATSHPFPLGTTGMGNMGHSGPPMPQFAPSSAPVTPIDYAKSIYGNLKTYKCVPVKVQEPLRSSSVSSGHHTTGSSNESISSSTTIGGVEMPPLSQQYIYGGNPNLNLNSPSGGATARTTHPLLQSAKDLELQQRQLIENLSSSHQQHHYQQQPSLTQQQQPLKLPPVSSELYARASPTQTMACTNPQLQQLPQLPQLHFADIQPQIYVPVVATETGTSNGPSGTKRPLSEV